jgi:predicted metal-binding protein
MKSTKDLNYYKNNCEEDYINTPISVLRYITELEQALQLQQTGVIYKLCVCGGNERVALDCTLKNCKHPKYCKK